MSYVLAIISIFRLAVIRIPWVHDERAIAECTLEDMQTLSGVTEEEANPSFLTVLTEFFGPEEETITRKTPQFPLSLRKVVERLPSPRFVVLGVVGLVLFSSLFLRGEGA